MIFFCFVIFEECVYECMKFDFLILLFLFWMRIHVWMHETLFLIFLDNNAYINAWNSIFWSSWMIMHILMHEILFFYFLFFFIFIANVCTNFSMILQMMIFFQRQCFKRYVQIFQKRRYVQKIFSMILKCFKIYVQRNIFQWFLPMFIQKDFSMIFFLNAYVQRIKKKSQKYVQTSKWTYV